MINVFESEMTKLVIHQVGNKANDEGMSLSNGLIVLDDLLYNLLSKYFLRPFVKSETYMFSHKLGLAYNEVYSEVSKVFDDIGYFVNFSQNISRFLYEQSNHPKIKAGEFYVVYFRNCILDGQLVDAIGLFKSENKDTFIRINSVEGGFCVESESGININKLDKGCLIFNAQREHGYVVSVVDNTNRGEAKYWVDDFLQVKRRNDDYAQTQNTLALCKEFVRQIPSANRVEKAQMMNRVIDGLSTDQIDVEELLTDVFGEEIVQTQFAGYRSMYEDKHQIEISSQFLPQKQAISRRLTSSLTTIKLDENFELKLLNSHASIERGYDPQNGMNYYKLWFREEK